MNVRPFVAEDAPAVAALIRADEELCYGRPGRVTGAVKVVDIKPSKRIQNLTQQLIYDVWRVNGDQKLGDCTDNDLAVAIVQETVSAGGHAKNATFYSNLKEPMKSKETVRTVWKEKTVRAEIEKVYGEFRKEEAA